MYGLQGKVAIVTGSGRHGGLGKAMAKRLGEEGCKVVVADLGHIEGDLFPTHGVATTAELEEVAAEERDVVLGVNLRGRFLCAKHIGRQLIAQGRGGRIVDISSQGGTSGFPYASAYAASKHGVIGFTRSVATELGSHRVTVNAIRPNHVTTGLGFWQNDFFSKALGLTHEEHMTAMRSRDPLGRPGLPDDIAKACAWLCSEQAGYVTGEETH